MLMLTGNNQKKEEEKKSFQKIFKEIKINWLKKME
jgi:hypothetical protein